MHDMILLEIRAVPVESSRGRHNPRVVKRKMSNFPTKSRTASAPKPAPRFRYADHIEIVLLEIVLPSKTAGRKPGRSSGGQGREGARPPHGPPAVVHRQVFWEAHARAWRASGLTRKRYCERHGLSEASFNHWMDRLHHLFRKGGTGRTKQA
jgi:hypothetical protein